MWKPLMADQMLESFDIRKRDPGLNIENYRWMVPNDFRQSGHYYNALNKHHHLNPKMTKPNRYGYNRSNVLEKHGNLKSQQNLTGKIEPDFSKQIDDLENYAVHNRRGPVLERNYSTNKVVHYGPYG